MPEEGTMIAGRYRVERSLGRGGMAEVFLAHDERLDRPVALKVLASALSSDPAFVARFRREAQAAAGLSHPNIVTVYDWGEEAGSYFIAMEYARGRTLAEVIEAEAPLSAGRTALIGARIAAALAAAHRQGVVHRDVKPSNVIVGVEDAVKVTDFGIAQVVEEAGTRLTATGTVLGTPAYLSPEQAEGRAVDARSDVYSLGVVLYELATGSTPFQGDTPVALAYQHATEPLEPPSVRNPAVPAALDEVITESLAKDPEARPASAEQVRRRLAALTDPSRAPAAATTEVASTRVLPPSGGDRRLWWALAAAGAAALAAVVVFLVFGRGSGSAQPTTQSTASTHHTTTAPPPTTTTAPPTTTTEPTTTEAPPTAFAGYAVVAGSGTGELFCPDGVTLGTTGQTSPTAPPHNDKPADGASGKGGAAGCGSNGGDGGKGGKSSPDASGGSGGNGGAGGCPPATLVQMQAGTRPCNGSGSDGGSGGNGGNAAPGASGGNGGTGGAGGNTTNAKGGNGGNGGNAKPDEPGADGGPGQPGGGAGGTTSGVNGANGTDG